MSTNIKRSKKIFRIKYKPSSFIIYGLIIYFLIFLINPFVYTIYSLEGVLYYIVAFLLLLTGAFIVEKISRKKANKSTCFDVVLTRRAERFIQLISVISIVFLVVYFRDVTKLVAGKYIFANEDLRLALSDNRSLINKIAEMGMQIGPVAYLIASNASRFNYRITRPLSLLAFWAPSIGILAVGARGAAIIGLSIFMINNFLQKQSGRKYFKARKFIKKIAPYLIVILISYFIYSLFISRPGLSTSENIYLIHAGDMKLKPIYQEINQFFNYRLDPLYKLFMYYTHSFPTFTYFYPNSPTYGVFWGVLQFSFVFLVLNAAGIVGISPNAVGLYNPTAGLYSTFISYFIMDFGRVLALVAILLSGVFMGLIYRSYLKGKFGYFIYPVILTMALVSPIYYFWTVGRMDVILVWYIIVYPILKMLGLKTVATNKKVRNSYEISN